MHKRLRNPIFWAKAIQSVFLVAIVIGMLGAQHSQFDRVGGELMCGCGCGQMLLECNHVGCPSSPVMIQELRAQIAAGNSDKTILNWFAAKYGPTVLAAPIRGGFDDAAWIVPFALFVLATAGTFCVVWIWKRRHGIAAAATISLPTGLTPEEAALRERIRRETEY